MCNTISRACFAALLAVGSAARAQSVPAAAAVPPYDRASSALLDSIDARSVRISIDGINRVLGDTLGPLVAGPHSVAARLCTLSGGCIDLSTTITVTPPPETRTSTGLLSKILDVLLDVIRRFITP